MSDPQRETWSSDALLLTPEEAARVLRVGRTTVYALLKAGDLHPVHIGRSCRLSRAELERYVNRLDARTPRRSNGRRRTNQGRVAGGISAPGSHRSRRDGLPSPGSCHPHRQALTTQTQCRNSRGWLAASSASFRCAARVASNRRYLLRIQRTR